MTAVQEGKQGRWGALVLVVVGREMREWGRCGGVAWREVVWLQMELDGKRKW